MLDRETRTAILRLHRERYGIRRIARALGVSRNSVREVLRSGVAEVPRLERATVLDEHLPRVRELYVVCEGNLVRVAEELEAEGVSVAYSTLSAFCRRQGLGRSPPPLVGRYVFQPGEEMQHDTSPHDVVIGGRRRRVQCASVVLCFSRMLYARVYLRFRRFECRSFLTDGMVYFGGAAGRCMVDNTSVVRARGVGKAMEPAAEMAALEKRFGFEFEAHAIGDANRSARVERNFHYIENNFYPGRTFDSLSDLNRQLTQWCDKVNRKLRRFKVGQFVPFERYAIERPALKPLPPYIPEVYQPHVRKVDSEGYINLDRNRYSVPEYLPNGDIAVGRELAIRETLETIVILNGHGVVTTHERLEPGSGRRVTLTEHRRKRPRRREDPSPEERVLVAAGPVLEQLVGHLRKRHGGQALRAVRRLHRMYLDYPTDCLVAAIQQALAFGLHDLARIESMTLERIKGDFFKLPTTTPTTHEDHHHDGRRAPPTAHPTQAPTDPDDL